MAKAKRTPAKRVRTQRASVQKFDHGINIGLLLIVIITVLVVSVLMVHTLMNKSENMAGDAPTVTNYSSTYQIDQTAQ